jgi:hypothetical protein
MNNRNAIYNHLKADDWFQSSDTSTPLHITNEAYFSSTYLERPLKAEKYYCSVNFE